MARKISVKALMEDAEKFPSIQNVTNYSDSQKKLQGKKDEEVREYIIKKLKEDKCRIERGPPAMRPPFFSPAKMQSYKIPMEIVQIFVEVSANKGNGTGWVQLS